MSVEAPLKIEQHGAILHVGLNRPHKRNALNDASILALEACFDTLPQDVGAVILHGIGEHFSAGLDLSELTERNITEGLLHSRMWHRVFDKIQFGRVPVVSVLKGAVIGGGLELACATHIRIAEEGAFYALPEGQRGIFVGGGGSVRLPKLIGVARMADMMLTGRTYNAEDGVTLGFSQYLAKSGEGLAQAEALAQKLAQNAPMTTFAVLQALPRIAEGDSQSALLMESMMATIASSDAEAKRRIHDFLSKKADKTRKSAP